MNRASGITREFQDTLAAYCMENPDHFGLYLAGCNLSIYPMGQVRTILGSWRQNWRARRQPAVRPEAFRNVRVLVDAGLGGHHMSIWLPAVKSLSVAGISIGLAGCDTEPLSEARQVLDASPAGPWQYICVPNEAPAPRPKVVPPFAHSPRIPMRGLMGWTLEAMRTNLERLVACWESALAGSQVEAVLSTSPLGFWSSAMVRAAQRLGIPGVFLSTGLPSKTFYRNYQADHAIVWGCMAREGLRRSGWTTCDFRIARNPMLLSEPARREARKKRRQALGVRDEERLVLILGQKAFDVAFRIEGYTETCQMVGEGLAEASQSSDLRVLLRRHHGEKEPDTERTLRAAGLTDFLVSSSASLMEDIAAADVALSMHSTALDEAYLSGCPVIQVAAKGVPMEIDFTLVGAPLVRESTVLRDLILDLSWAGRLLPPEGTQPVGDILMELLRNNAQAREGNSGRAR